MDQEVLQDLYDRAKSKGYSKSIEEFQQLISSDNEVLNDNFEYVKSKGYAKDISDFSVLVGFGEKKNSNSTSEEVVTESTTETEASPSSLDSSSTIPSIEIPPVEQEEEIEISIPDAPSRKGTLQNEDGSVSTHKMKTETDGQGNWFSFPTVFQNEDGSFVDMSEQAEQDWNSVYEEAQRRGEVINFGSDKNSAIQYGKGSWKNKFDARNNNELLNSVGYLEAQEGLPEFSKIEVENISGSTMPAREVEDGYFVMENGERVYKKESELDPKVVEAIKLYESANSSIKPANHIDVELTEEDYANEDNISDELLQSNGIDDIEDYRKWDKKNSRKETKTFKFFKQLLASDEGDQFETEKRDYEKIQAYKASKLNRVTEELNKIQASLKLTTKPEEIKELKELEKELTTEFIETASEMTNTINSFSKYKEYTEDADLKRRKRMYNAAKEGGIGEYGQATSELIKTGGNTIASFAVDFFGGIPGFFDQRLNNLGFDNKGVLAGLSDMLTDSADHVELEYGAVQRKAFIEGKPVYYKGEMYTVDSNGTVYDNRTNVRMDGIISDFDIKEIQDRSKDVPNTEIQWTGGATLQGGVQTLSNLFALIRTGKKVNKAMGLEKYMKAGTAGKVGMGVASFTSSVTDNVDDIRSQLMSSGMGEKEAMEYAVNAGQAIATLDGIFSGLAGSNEKLLTGFQGIKEQIKNLAVSKGKDFSKKQLIDKGKSLMIENIKELGVEELPVLFAERGINYLVNESIGKEVLNQKVTKADAIETAVMTIGATSTLGSKKLLTGNRRADLVRTVAKDIDNLQETLDVLVKEGSLTQKQAMNAYTEIYNSQSAELKTKGTILVSSNLEEADGLLTQRQNLLNEREGLEGPAKKKVDQRIADIDAQIDALYKKDEEQARAIMKGEQEGETEVTVTDTEVLEALKADGIESPTEQQKIKKSDELIKIKQDAIQKPSTEKQVLPDDAASKKDGTESEVGLRQVGKGNVESGVTQEGDTETETETDQTSDSTTQTDTEQITETSTDQEVMSVNKERVDTIVDGIVEKTKNRSVKGEQTNPQKLADNAISYLEGSKLFQEANDTERETILRDVSKKLGVEITPPTAKKLLGIKRIGKPTTIKVASDYSALKKDLRKEQKIARDAKNDVNKRRKGLQGAIDAVLKVGNITTKKANSLLKKVSNVNLYNAKKVQDVIDFTERAMNDAEYSSKLEKANKLQKIIKTKLKGKEAGLSDAAKEFAKVNPSNVSDIDNYLEKAEAVNKGLTPTRKPSKGDLKVTKPFDIKKITEYSKKEVEAESKRNYELAKESFQQLTGTEAGDLTLEEIREALNEVEGKTMTPEARAELENKKKKIIDKAINNAFKNTKINIKGAIESGDIKVTKAQKTLINNFLNMDLSIMSTADKMKALDAIVNFELNQSTGGMQAAFKRQVGNLEMIRIRNKNIKSSENSTSLGRIWNQTISTLPNAFELVFKSQQKARAVMKAMGLDGVINGSAKAQTEASNVENDYANAFAKKKMQKGIYFDVSNDMQRGILGEVRRVTPGTEAEQKAEFEKSKKLIKETYEALLKSNNKIQKRKGEAIKEQYNKLLKDSKTISEVESKADPVNLQGVEYVTKVWSEKYSELADVSLNVYNRNLGNDTNYTPRNFQNLKEEKKVRDITEPVFDPSGLRQNAYDKETGVLKPATKPDALPKGKILNLGFDSQNMNNYKAALTDLYTAPSIQQIKGARQSKAFNDVFTNEGSREIINQRINNYVDAKRGKSYATESEKRYLRRLNRVATLGVSRVLGGPTQVLKQIVPIFNTGVNAGIINTIKGANLLLNPDVRKAIKNSGLPIANRGLQSQADIEGVDTRMTKKANTAGGKIVDAADQINKKTIELFLVAPDVATAQASFIAYYLEAMNKKGVKSGDIDFTKPLDKEAAQFAQQQVDRQQNTSDQDLQGELFTSKNKYTQTARKIFFPFANFLLNQKTRMYSDVNTLVNNPTALPGDKTRAAKSLGGLAVETVMFNALGLGITQTLSKLARMVSGEEEDDPNLNRVQNKRKKREEEEKQLMSRVRGRLGNMIADVLVPVPILNDETLNQINGLMSIFQEGDDDPFKFFAKTEKNIMEGLGTLGIAPKKAAILKDMIMTIQSGEMKGEYMGRSYSKELTPEAIDKLKYVAMAYAMHSVGVPVLNMSEVGYISERAFKNISKMTPKEEKYDIETDAVNRLEDRGIKKPSQKLIDQEKKRIRKENKGQATPRKRNGKSFKPSSGGGGSFKPKSFGN